MELKKWNLRKAEGLVFRSKQKISARSSTKRRVIGNAHGQEAKEKRNLLGGNGFKEKHMGCAVKLYTVKIRP